MILYCVYKDSKKQTGEDQVAKSNGKGKSREDFDMEVMVCNSNQSLHNK